jgi:hypothetical protein
MSAKRHHTFTLRPLKIKRSWLNPTQLASNYGFSSRELNELERLVDENEAVFLEAWNEHFGQH